LQNVTSDSSLFYYNILRYFIKYVIAGFRTSINDILNTSTCMHYNIRHRMSFCLSLIKSHQYPMVLCPNTVCSMPMQQNQRLISITTLAFSQSKKSVWNIMLASSQSKKNVWDIRGDVEESKLITLVKNTPVVGRNL
jgi:hypothetical protein